MNQVTTQKQLLFLSIHCRTYFAEFLNSLCDWLMRLRTKYITARDQEQWWRHTSQHGIRSSDDVTRHSTGSGAVTTSHVWRGLLQAAFHEPVTRHATDATCWRWHYQPNGNHVTAKQLDNQPAITCLRHESTTSQPYVIFPMSVFVSNLAHFVYPIIACFTESAHQSCWADAKIRRWAACRSLVPC